MPRVAHFEIRVEGPQRALKFYTEVFGWTVKKMDAPFDYWKVGTHDHEAREEGIDGGVVKTGGEGPIFINLVIVDSVDEYIEKVEKNGGSILTPKHTIPTVGYQAICQDPEGLTFALQQIDRDAR